MYLNKRKNIYYCICYFDPISYNTGSISTKTKNKSQALKFLTRFEMEMQKRKNEGVIPICIKDFVFEYLVYSSAIHTEKTTKAFKVTFNQLKKFFGNIQLIKLTTIKMQEYIKHRIESSSIYAARKDLINLSSAFNRAVNNHYLINNPCKVIKRIKIPEKQPKFLSNLIIKYKFFITCIKDLQILCNS